MAGRKRGEIVGALVRGRDRFETWRRSRRAGARIPEKLWTVFATETHEGLSLKAYPRKNCGLPDSLIWAATRQNLLDSRPAGSRTWPAKTPIIRATPVAWQLLSGWFKIFDSSLIPRIGQPEDIHQGPSWKACG